MYFNCCSNSSDASLLPQVFKCSECVRRIIVECLMKYCTACTRRCFRLHSLQTTNCNTMTLFCRTKLNQVISSSSAIAERPRCRVGHLWPKVEDCNRETIFDRHYRSVVCLQALWRNLPAKQSNSVKKKHKIRVITQLKVTQGHRRRCQSKASMQLNISD